MAATVSDALRGGFEVVVMVDALRAIDQSAVDGDRDLAEIRSRGAALDDLAASHSSDKARAEPGNER